MFYICLTWLMTSSVMSMMMSSVTSLMMSSCMTSSVMCPVTQRQKQTFHNHILRARPPRSRLLSTLGGLANSPVGGMPPGEVWSGFLDTPTVASTAERNWSVFGFVHSKSRNRLYGHKVENLVYIYQNMRLLRKIRDPAFREPCVLPDHMFDEDEEEEE